MYLVIYAHTCSYFIYTAWMLKLTHLHKSLIWAVQPLFRILSGQGTWLLIFITGRPNFEEGGPTSVGRKHEFIRSESENWRIFREEQNGEDEDGGWRLAGSRRDGERWRPHSPGKRSEWGHRDQNKWVFNKEIFTD